MRDESEREFGHKTSELQLIVESKMAELEATAAHIDGLQSDVMRLTSELHAAQSEIDGMRESNAIVNATVDTTEDIDADEVDSALNLKNVELQTNLRAEEVAHQQTMRKVTEMTAHLRQVEDTNAKLRDTMNLGIEELRVKEKQQRQLHTKDMNSTREELAACMQKRDDLTSKISLMTATHERNVQLNEREKVQLTESVNRQREACEAAQQRVLEIATCLTSCVFATKRRGSSRRSI